MILHHVHVGSERACFPKVLAAVHRILPVAIMISVIRHIITAHMDAGLKCSRQVVAM